MHIKFTHIHQKSIRNILPNFTFLFLLLLYHAHIFISDKLSLKCFTCGKLLENFKKLERHLHYCGMEDLFCDDRSFGTERKMEIERHITELHLENPDEGEALKNDRNLIDFVIII